MFAKARWCDLHVESDLNGLERLAYKTFIRLLNVADACAFPCLRGDGNLEFFRRERTAAIPHEFLLRLRQFGHQTRQLILFGDPVEFGRWERSVRFVVAFACRVNRNESTRRRRQRCTTWIVIRPPVANSWPLRLCGGRSGGRSGGREGMNTPKFLHGVYVHDARRHRRVCDGGKRGRRVKRGQDPPLLFSRARCAAWHCAVQCRFKVNAYSITYCSLAILHQSLQRTHTRTRTLTHTHTRARLHRTHTRALTPHTNLRKVCTAPAHSPTSFNRIPSQIAYLVPRKT